MNEIQSRKQIHSVTIVQVFIDDDMKTFVSMLQNHLLSMSLSSFHINTPAK